MKINKKRSRSKFVQPAPIKKKSLFKTRIPSPDVRYDSILVSQLINKVMKDGKKSLAIALVYGALNKVSRIIRDKSPVEILTIAINNVSPKYTMRRRKVGSGVYRIPCELDDSKKVKIALLWLIKATTSRNENIMEDRLSKEIVDTYNNVGRTVKIREDHIRDLKASLVFNRNMNIVL